MKGIAENVTPMKRELRILQMGSLKDVNVMPKITL
jgi:hypothetical protein